MFYHRDTAASLPIACSFQLSLMDPLVPAPIAQPHVVAEVLSPSFFNRVPIKKALIIGIYGRVSLSSMTLSRLTGTNRAHQGNQNQNQTYRITLRDLPEYEDVKSMYALLIGNTYFFEIPCQFIFDLSVLDRYSYTLDEISLLLDDGNPDNIQPTEHNIVGRVCYSNIIKLL